jgi:hypothetical protein
MRPSNQRVGSTNFIIVAAFIVVFLLTCFGEADAQVVVKYTVLPPANIILKNPPPGEKAELGMNILDIGVEFPIYSKGDEETGAFSELSNKIDIRRHEFRMELPAGETEYFPDTVYAIKDELVLIKSLPNDWYTVTVGSLGIYSDFENIDQDHFLFEGGLIIVKKINRNLDLGLGPVFTYAFGEAVLIPAPFVKYQSEGNVTFEVKFPRFATLGYTFSEDFQVRFAARSLYNNYRLGDERAEDPNGKSTVIVFSDITLGLESSIQLFDEIFLDLAIGRTVNRTFYVNDDNGDELFDRELEEANFFSVGLAAMF